MTLRDLPNLISALRILLVVPIVWLLLEERYGMALFLFAVAGISDGVDGYLAKRFQWITRLGSVLDPLADKLLMVSSYLALGWLGHLPAWLVAVVIARDVVIVSGASFYHVAIEPVEMRPTLLSKINTVLQIALILVVLVAQISSLPAATITTLVYAVLATTIGSGISYVWTWSCRARAAVRARRDSD